MLSLVRPSPCEDFLARIRTLFYVYFSCSAEGVSSGSGVSPATMPAAGLLNVQSPSHAVAKVTGGAFVSSYMYVCATIIIWENCYQVPGAQCLVKPFFPREREGGVGVVSKPWITDFMVNLYFHP